MKKLIITSLIVAMVVGLGIAFAEKPDPDKKGNGLPKGKCYNLNIIGIPKGENYNKELNDNFTGGNGKRIFVQRTGTTSFYVYGDDTTSYAVLDRNGTDGKVGEPGRGLANAGITFPYDETTDTWQVEIWVRLVGPKGSEINWKSYYYDTVGNVYVKWADFDIEKSSKFSLKTGSLLKDGYQDILWELMPKHKFRILQMRIFVD